MTQTPPPPAREPLDPAERELANLLDRLPDASPSPQLDARILAAANAAVRSAPQPRKVAWWRSIGIGAAASALLGIGLLVQTQRHRPDTSAPLPAAAPEAGAPSTAASSASTSRAIDVANDAVRTQPMQTPLEIKPPPPAETSPMTEPTLSAAPAGSALAREKAVSVQTMPPPKSIPPQTVGAAQSFPAMSPPAPPAPPPPAPPTVQAYSTPPEPSPTAQAFPAPAAPAPANSDANAALPPRQEAAEPTRARFMPAPPPAAAPAPANNRVSGQAQKSNEPANMAPMRDERGAAAAKVGQPPSASNMGGMAAGVSSQTTASGSENLLAIPINADAKLPPSQWLDRIRARLRAGDRDGARASLHAFQARHPDVAIPDDLKI
ncbi:MAG: hypothetical protein JSR34_10710 [Proteobacteria bacterium]|nr:hypothetical protein [Pseudomonadota bacterium]